jgi:hypothetical protein
MVSSCNRCLKKSFQWFYAAGNINHNSFKQILKVIKGYHPVVYILFKQHKIEFRPSPGLINTFISTPCNSTNCFEILRPGPVAPSL